MKVALPWILSSTVTAEHRQLYFPKDDIRTSKLIGNQNTVNVSTQVSPTLDR
ncbi:hypothetical protein PSTG_18186 [Puccinia striiformis f. sp. tritici PST-78]|uniref:Uncharacterized protein n=1 Tax=Puccinia striiformis f. sp. tritici PST-78 TaxID=1165861 RepID=A0A0L0UNS8_9BASI|nr:hypothetical protein PSTG_18186 [Puccinia striiformis f. sp. tritici PST-78]